MNCGYKEKIMLHFYGELPGAEAELSEHLANCSTCAEDFAVLKSLAEEFSAFRPEPPALRALSLIQAARSLPLSEWFMAVFKRFALAGAATAMFLLAFQSLAPGGITGWGELDSHLDTMEYGIYSLQDDMVFSSADFDYGCADIENQKEQAAEKAA